MKEGFFVRVCLDCLDRQGREYMYLSIFGCRLDDDIRECITKEEDRVIFCKEYFTCPIRKHNPDLRGVTTSFCTFCTDRRVKK